MAFKSESEAMKKAFFLDRDGVINKDHGYVSSWDKFELFETTYEALRLIKQHGYLIIVITNQSGIARSYFTESDFDHLMEQFKRDALEQNIEIDDVFHCPHHPEGVISGFDIKYNCRKPKSGMIMAAASNIKLTFQPHSW